MTRSEPLTRPTAPPRRSCPGCHTFELRPSRPRGWERVLLLALLRPYRCHCCMRRWWRPRALW